MADQPKKVCVILGAGASTDIEGIAAPPIDKRWRPPLANELFNMAARPKFEDHLMRYSGAQSLAQDIAQVVDAGEIGLEARLRELAFHDDPDIQERFKEIPAYIRDVIKDCTIGYVNYPSNYSRLAQYLVSEVPHEVLFVALNYDNMLEKVLRYLYRIPFQELADYMKNRRNIRILKFHGSMDWFVPMGGGNNWHEALDHFSLSSVDTGNIVVHNTTANLTVHRPGNQYHFPALTAPIAGKDEDSIMAPLAHRQTAREFLADCKKVLIVGCSGVDEDLIQFLNSSFKEEAYLHIVSKGRGAPLSAAHFRNVAALEGSLLLDESRTVYKNGFSEYLNSDWFGRFLSI